MELGCTMDEAALRQALRKLLDIDNEVYSTRMAFVFCLVLSAFLWWIPVIGPAVAGYVCGRKTGSMVKGLMCTLIAGTLLLFIIKGISAVILVHGGYPGVPADEAALAFTGVAGSVAAYLQTFFAEGTTQLNYLGLGVATVFGAVGGILSRQIRKETAHLISLGMTECSVRPVARSIQLYNAHKEMGFKSFDDCMEMQKMTTNENDLSVKHKGGKAGNTKAQEVRPVATTVQTVTTTVSGNAEQAQSKEQGSPFADILERSDLKKDK